MPTLEPILGKDNHIDDKIANYICVAIGDIIIFDNNSENYKQTKNTFLMQLLQYYWQLAKSTRISKNDVSFEPFMQ